MTTTTGLLRLADIAPDVLQDLAVRHGVCVRPVLSRLTDTTTGEVSVVPIPCGSTQARKCPPCAERARRLRMQQCREGWHRDDELPADDLADADELTADELETPTSSDGCRERRRTRPGTEVDESGRRVRSTRRRQDVPDLPRVPMDNRPWVAPSPRRTVGRTGRACSSPSPCRPTARVGPDGTPLDPDSYDYHRAALDALHFPKLVDRFWQNLRRCAGLQGPVLRHRRSSTPPRPTPARRRPRRDPAPGRAQGRRRHLSPALVAALRPGHVLRRQPAGLR